ncbi:MAG: hypothetical protein R2731_12810 [Nocardioides sp.]
MPDTDLHPLVHDYLARLTLEAQRLPQADGTELVADITEHLREALAPRAGEADVRTVLDRLGTPAELVTAAGAPAAVTTPTASRPATWGAVEILALVALVGAELGFFLVPVSPLAWIVGLVLLAVSRVWTPTEKLLGYLGLGTGFPAAVVLSLAWLVGGVRQTCTGVGCDTGGLTFTNVAAIAVTVGFLAFQVWTFWRLTRAARR